MLHCCLGMICCNTLCRYLMKNWDIAHKDSVFLCDDHNDLELAAVVGLAFLPTISSVGVPASPQYSLQGSVVSQDPWVWEIVLYATACSSRLKLGFVEGLNTGSMLAQNLLGSIIEAVWVT